MCGREGSHLSTDVERESGGQVETSAADRNQERKSKRKRRHGAGKKVSHNSLISLSGTLNSDGHESRRLELEI